jgi:hypothetical protein
MSAVAGHASGALGLVIHAGAYFSKADHVAWLDGSDRDRPGIVTVIVPGRLVRGNRRQDRRGHRQDCRQQEGAVGADDLKTNADVSVTSWSSLFGTILVTFSQNTSIWSGRFLGSTFRKLKLSV